MQKEQENDVLDPRIKVELENLNTATDEINKLEIELEEAKSTFRILYSESTRRLKLLTKKMGNCILKARPYYEALDKAREAQIQCQKAAVKFQRANSIHMAAKETVALAEQRFMSNSHEWQFDNAWQEMLNHATLKVMDAETNKTECHAEHQRKAHIFNSAEMLVQQLEERLRRHIHKSSPYFEEKQICMEQLQTQKNRIDELELQVQVAKSKYSAALRSLEIISEEIHKQRGDIQMAAPPGPREPGVGAELSQLPDFKTELSKCDGISMGSVISLGDSTTILNDKEDYASDDNGDDTDDVEILRQRVKTLAVRPVEGGDGQQEQAIWENELNATVDKLDHLMMLKESAALNQNIPNKILNNITINDRQLSLPTTPQRSPTVNGIKSLKKVGAPPSVNVSMRELPLLARLSNEIYEKAGGYLRKRRRSLN